MFGYLSEMRPNPCLHVRDNIVFYGNVGKVGVGKESSVISIISKNI